MSLLIEHRQRLIELAKQLAAPFFFYDIDACLQHVSQLSAPKLQLWYAVKANPLSAVIRCMNQAGLGCDVASMGELKQVLSQSVPADQILNTGPAKSKQHFEQMLAAGVRIFVLESLQQAQDLQELSDQYHYQPQVLLRVQLIWQQQGDTKNVLGGCALTPFGLTPNDWQQFNIGDYPNLSFCGLHIFQWGNMLKAADLGRVWQMMVPQLQQLAQALSVPLDILDLGGGLGIPYANESPLSWSDVQHQLAQVQQQLPQTTIWMELGRYAIGAFGCYLCQVVDRKVNHGQQQLVLSGGVNHLLRPTLTGQSFPVSLLRDSQAETSEFAVHGPLCTGLDDLGKCDLPHDVAVGDWLVFSQCGAYGFTESMPWFLCHTLPGEVVYQQGEVVILRQPESAQSWLK